MRLSEHCAAVPRSHVPHAQAVVVTPDLKPCIRSHLRGNALPAVPPSHAWFVYSLLQISLLGGVVSGRQQQKSTHRDERRRAITIISTSGGTRLSYHSSRPVL